MIDERTEQLMNRRLDGEITAVESLELDKLLIRDPHARRLMDEYARLDALAGEAIRSAVNTQAAPTVPTAGATAGWRVPQRQWWYSFGLVSAVAAAITLAVLLSQRAATIGLTGRAGQVALHEPADTARDPGRAVDYIRHVDGPRRETLNLDRDVIGVWDHHTGSLYLLEADTTRSRIEPVKANY